MNNNYGKIALIMVVVLATVIVSGCIGDSTDKFTKEVNVEGVTFFLPDGFEQTDSRDNGINRAYDFSDGTDTIVIIYYPGASKALILSQMKASSAFTNIQEDVSYGGISGHTAGDTQSKTFVFEKNGKTFAIVLGNNLNFEEYIPKILG